MITHIFFDLDNTLYPKSSRLLEAINDRITQFVALYLSVSAAEAERMRMKRGKRYSTTYKWLVEEHGFTDIEEYMDAVHPKDIESYLTPDTRLGELLSTLKRRRFILTNSPMEHAVRVLKFLEIDEYFEGVFDLRGNRFIGKPDKDIVAGNLKEAGADPRSSLLIDDHPVNVTSFIEMGGYGVLVDEEMKSEGPVDRIPSVLEITDSFIDALEGRRLARRGAAV